MSADEQQINSLFRSRPMSYVSVTAMMDIAYDTIRELGNFGVFHVVDLNAGKDLPDKNISSYKKRVQDCMQFERKISDLERQMEENGIPVPLPLPEKATIHHTHKDNTVLPEIWAQLEPVEEGLKRSVAVRQQITRTIAELTERKWVYNTCREMQIGRQEAVDDKSDRDVELGERSPIKANTTGDGMDIKTGGLGVSLLSADYHAPVAPGASAAAAAAAAEKSKFMLPKFRSTLTGVLPTDKQQFFQRMLYRVSRGNAVSNFTDIPEPIPDSLTGEPVLKSVFSVIIVVSELLEKRIQKVCQLFQATLVKMPETNQAINDAIRRCDIELDEQRNLHRTTGVEIQRTLRRVAGPDEKGGHPIREWQYLLRCEKSICDALMKCHFYLNMIALEGWCPTEDFNALRAAVKRAVPPGDKGIPEPAVEVDPERPIRDPGMPPTYFKLNKFTSIYQGIVNTYGVPRYQEVNPGLFTIVTFPFLFGVMYGDIGHGTILTICSLLMIIFEDRLTRYQQTGKMNEIFRMCFGGRYLLVCMGIMGVYCGTLYNDCMSIPISLYPSSWSMAPDATVAHRTGAVYPYGVDPAWYHTKNQLTFFNGMKMKTSVIIGVTQMSFGIVLGLLNHIHFSDQISIWFEFVPQLTFMLCTFGYMCVLIIIKWCTDWTQSSTEPPNLIQTMIGMFLGLGAVESGKELYGGQAQVQVLLLVFAFGSIPIMLLAKPCYLAYCKKHDAHKPHAHASHAHPPANAAAAANPANAAPAGHQQLIDGENPKPAAFDEKGEPMAAAGGSPAGAVAVVEEEHTFGDYMIHQSIHTIEFVLGTVSNTASYLRLWALSLAHSELADVFWTKLILEYGLYKDSAFFAMIAVAAWFVMTVGVLLMMDVLECFLHALRLHWVEFQNKFFHADGYAFRPFSYDVIEDS